MMTVTMPKQLEIDERAIRKATADIAIDIAKLVRDRTRIQGKDVNGNAFHKYSEATQTRKEKEGKPGFVDLTDHSNMINSVKAQPILNGYEVYIAEPINNKKGFYHNMGTKNLPKREWFGISKPDAEKIYLKYGRTLKVFK